LTVPFLRRVSGDVLERVPYGEPRATNDANIVGRLVPGHFERALSATP
jgi:hypothetical protein